MKTEMWIENKYNIGDTVGFGGYMSMVTGLRLTGKPLNILYEISFFDNCENYKTFVVDDFELDEKETEFGFKPKGE